jgi:hypothetical protein
MDAAASKLNNDAHQTITPRAWSPQDAVERLISATRRRGIVSILLPVLAFVIYLRTLAPGLLPGDSGEFQFAAWGWTIAHPTGYPLYLLVGGIWQHLVVLGDPAFRLNLLSAVFSALAVLFSYRIFVRVARHRGAALIAAITFAISQTFWSQATESEVYALNTLFIAILTWLALKWQARREFKYSAAWALTFGLSLTHHRTIMLLIPAFAAFFAEALFERAQRYKSWRKPPDSRWVARDAAYAALVALPLLLYAYIPVRAAVTPYIRLQVSPAQVIWTFDNTPAGWVSHALGRSFESDLAINGASLGSLEALPQRFVSEFNPLGALLGLIGLVAIIYRRRWPLVALTCFATVAVILFDVSYHIGDIADFYTPAYFFFTVWIAAGLGTILEYIRDHVHMRGSLFPSILMLFIAAALPVENFSGFFVQEDRSLQTEWRDRWETILKSDLPPNSILVSNDRDEMTPMWYLQIVEGLRPDALGLFPQISQDLGYSNVMRLLGSVIDSGRPVFLIKSIPGIGLRYRLDSAPGGLVRVATEPLPAPTRRSGAIVGKQLEVVGYSIISGAARPGGQFTAAVYWQTLVPLDRDYSTSLQIFGSNGKKIAQGDDHPPGGDAYPTSQWQRGETLRDLINVAMPIDTNPGVYHLFVKVYDPASGDPLGDLTEIGTLRVTE